VTAAAHEQLRRLAEYWALRVRAPAVWLGHGGLPCFWYKSMSSSPARTDAIPGAFRGRPATRTRS